MPRWQVGSGGTTPNFLILTLCEGEWSASWLSTVPLPLRKGHLSPTAQEAVGVPEPVCMLWGTKNSPALCQESTMKTLVIQTID